MKKSVLLLLLLFWGLASQAQQNYSLKGKIIDSESGEPIPGVNILLKGSLVGTVSNSDGQFELTLPSGLQQLKISYIGYNSLEPEVQIPHTGELIIRMQAEDLELREFQVVSTGFQELSPERSTGSFASLDQKLVNRKVSSNLMERMGDVTPGLIILIDSYSANAEPKIQIRGSSTILADNQPLIVVDNLAYDGPLSSINPNDVESITVLKDAAAASIWGARAGNGVIVITTKKGSANEAIRISLNSNATWGQGPDLYYPPLMSVSSFVDQEARLFEQGYYDGQVNAWNKPRLSPVVETLLQHREGELSDAEKEQAMQTYKSQDVRRDLNRYFYRPTLNQQYSLGLRGGSSSYSYAFSAGWDKNQSNRVTEQNSRLTLSSRQDWNLMKEKFHLGLGTYWSLANSESAVPDIANFSIYDQLADESGNPLVVSRGYSDRFKSSVMDLGLLNWDYVPLNEIGMSPQKSRGNDLRVNLDLSYQINRSFSASAYYQYWSNWNYNSFLQPLESYYSRDQINIFSFLDETGTLSHAIPVGGILDEGQNRSFSHTFRGQLNFDKQWEQHEIHALGGMEIKDRQSNGSNSRSYGFDPSNGLSQPVDYIGRYNQLPSGFSYTVPFLDSYIGTINRYLSAFANLGYSFQNKYLLNASARMDKSNLYGVNTNQKTVPLWSLGLGWIASEEDFMNLTWISFLKVKATYGYNGNTYNGATAYTTAQYYGSGSNSLVGHPFLGILTPPNPELRWERIKIVNMGLDYELWKGKLSGSMEFYNKSGLDLLGNITLYPSSGMSSAVMNYASSTSSGIDLNLTYRTKLGALNWTSTFFYSKVKEKITEIENSSSALEILRSQPGESVPIEGKPLNYIYSFPWAGLDPDTGAPQGLLEGSVSQDYNNLIRVPEEELIYHGSSRPTSFGAWRNQLDWKGWSLSANISYRLGYYFRNQSVDYDNLNRGIITHGDYENRWKAEGDQTEIPADPGTVDPSRTTFYAYSSILVERGDHIRLQDIRFAKTFALKNGIQMEIYSYLNNLGIIWKASDRVSDPDNRFSRLPKTAALGARINF